MLYFACRRVVRTWISAAIWSSHYAVDGVALNQSRALAGVTPDEVPGFLSQTRSYRLRWNLNVPESVTTAIQIIANLVTLEMLTRQTRGQQ